jgi:hypothetical protein
VALALLGRIDSAGAARALALVATWGRSPEIRRIAAETLSHRDPRDYVGFLLSLLREPFHFQTAYVETETQRSLQRSFAVQRGDTIMVTRSNVDSIPVPLQSFTGALPFDPFGQAFAATPMGAPGGPMFDPRSAQWLQAMIARPEEAIANLAQHPAAAGHGQTMRGPALQAPLTADQHISAFVQSAMACARWRDALILAARTSPFIRTPRFQTLYDAAQAADSEIRQTNSEIFASLNLITSQDLPEDPEPWRKWYYDAQGYAYTRPKAKPKKLVVLSIPSCFAAGTPVRTLSSLRPIEEIAVGDQVLAQDPITGKLSFEPVTGVHHNPPGETLKVQTVRDAILPSIYHRFWRSGQGFTMARDLKAGDQLHTLEGLERVTSVSPGGVQKVYNLDVAFSHSCFVGEGGALVHDNTLPALRAERFDSTSK